MPEGAQAGVLQVLFACLTLSVTGDTEARAALVHLCFLWGAPGDPPRLTPSKH